MIMCLEKKSFDDKYFPNKKTKPIARAIGFAYIKSAAL